MSRVAIVHYTAPPVVGGVERVITRHVGLMLDAGHEVSLVVGRGSATDRRANLVTIGLLDSLDPAISALREALDAGRVPDAFPRVRDAIASRLRGVLAGVDVVFAHNICSMHFNLALTAALHELVADGSITRLVAWHHDLAWTMERYLPVLHAGHPWDLLRTAWPGVVGVAVSETRRAQLAALMAIEPSSVRVVPNGLDIEEDLGLAPETRDLLAVTDLLAADPLLLTPARLTPRKNIELGLEVVARLRAGGHDAALVVTGPVDPHDRTQEAYLRRLRTLRSRLGLDGIAWLLASDLGAEPSDQLVVDLYRIADVLFLPSHEEGFGLPVLEAALHRLPIVCSDLPVLREVAGEAAQYLSADVHPQTAAEAVLARLERDPEASLWRRIRREYAWPAVFREGIAPLLEG